VAPSVSSKTNLHFNDQVTILMGFSGPDGLLRAIRPTY
jgi:hypothetical protein